MMAEALSKKELKLALVAARIGPVPEGRHQAVVELQRRLDDAGYLEVAGTIARREKEEGISYRQAVDDYEAVVKAGRRKEQAEKIAADLEARVRELEAEVKGAVAKTKVAVAGQAQEEKHRQAMREDTAREEARLQQQVARARDEAEMSLEQIGTAVRINTQVQKHGLNLDVVLAASEEFGADEGATERLSVQLKENKALTGANVALEARNEELQGQVTALQAQKAKLTENVEWQQYLRRFHKRYAAASPLLEEMGTWGDVVLLSCPCGMKFIAAAPAEALGLRPRWPKFCPNCGKGEKELMWLEPAYRALDMPVGFIRVPLPKVE